MSEFEDRLTRDLAQLAHTAVPSERPIPPLPRPAQQPARASRRFGGWWAQVLAAALVIAVVGAGWVLTQSAGRDDARPAVTDSATPTPTSSAPSPSATPSVVPSTTLSIAPSATPSVTASSAPPPADPTVVRFDGVGPFRLGMSSAELLALGYSSSGPNSFGCAQYFRGSFDESLNVIADPVLDRVKSIGVPSRTAGYRTEAGIQIGSSEAEVQAAYAGYEIVDRQFGQATEGLLITGPLDTFLGFTMKDGVVSGIEIADEADFATNSEVSCTDDGQS